MNKLEFLRKQYINTHYSKEKKKKVRRLMKRKRCELNEKCRQCKVREVHCHTMKRHISYTNCFSEIVKIICIKFVYPCLLPNVLVIHNTSYIHKTYCPQ